MKATKDIKPKHTNLNDYAIVHLLSKSTFLKGKQCEKMLYLNKYKKKEASAFSKQTQVSLDYGKSFEASFREKFAEAINLPDVLGNLFHTYAGFTKELLESKTAKNIFEAGLIYKDVLILIDVLQQNEDGSFTVYEVKNMSALKPVVIWDLALQYYVCKNTLPKIESFNVVLRTKKGKLKISDMTKFLDKKLEEVAQEVLRFKAVLDQETVPNIKIGSQCFKPYRCQFFDYCRT